MKKPNNFENTQCIGDFETLEAGAYKCKILQAEECTASNGKEFIKLSFDIVEGDKKDFYRRKYNNDTRTDKKWSGVMTIFAEDYEGNTNRYFKTLITCAEESNSGYKFDFDKVTDLKDKKIGIVFREEEFIDTMKQIKIAVKPFRACNYDKTEEQKIPNRKEISDDKKEALFDATFSSIPSDNSELPF